MRSVAVKYAVSAASCSVVEIELRHLHQQIRPVRRPLPADRIGQRRIEQLVADAVERRRRHRGHQRREFVVRLGDGDELVLQARAGSCVRGAIDSLPLMTRQAIELHQQIAPRACGDSFPSPGRGCE